MFQVFSMRLTARRCMHCTHRRLLPICSGPFFFPCVLASRTTTSTTTLLFSRTAFVWVGVSHTARAFLRLSFCTLFPLSLALFRISHGVVWGLGVSDGDGLRTALPQRSSSVASTSSPFSFLPSVFFSHPRCGCKKKKVPFFGFWRVL
jgi:hypothetical protein